MHANILTFRTMMFTHKDGVGIDVVQYCILCYIFPKVTEISLDVRFTLIEAKIQN